MTLLRISPCRALDYLRDKGYGHSKLGCHFFLCNAIGAKSPYLFGNGSGYFLAFAKDIHCMPGVFRGREILKINQSVISLVSILMVNLARIGAWANECLSNGAMNCAMLCSPINAECHEQVAIAPKRWPQEIRILFLICCSIQDSPNCRLSYSNGIGYRSLGRSFRTKVKNLLNLRLRKPSMKQIPRGDATHIPHVTNGITAFESNNLSPCFHDAIILQRGMR